jgi:O-methyltransferase
MMFVKELLTKLKTLATGRDRAPPPAGPEQLDTIDRSQLTIFFERDPLVELYENSMNSTQAPADSFFKRCRFFALAQLCEVALTQHDRGDIVECGCWRGHSAHMISVLATQHAFKGVFHIFDSFEGLSGLTQEDRSERYNLSKEQIEDQARWFACPEDVVKANLSEFSFIKTYKGWVPDRFSEVADRQFSFVHIDLDLYKPIADSIEFFYPRMLKGGIMVFDDYGSARFPGAKKAIDDALTKYKPAFFFRHPTGGAFLIV